MTVDPEIVKRATEDYRTLLREDGFQLAAVDEDNDVERWCQGDRCTVELRLNSDAPPELAGWWGGPEALAEDPSVEAYELPPHFTDTPGANVYAYNHLVRGLLGGEEETRQAAETLTWKGPEGQAIVLEHDPDSDRDHWRLELGTSLVVTATAGPLSGRHHFRRNPGETPRPALLEVLQAAGAPRRVIAYVKTFD